MFRHHTSPGTGGRKDDQRAALARHIQQRYRLPSKLPKLGEVIEL